MGTHSTGREEEERKVRTQERQTDKGIDMGTE